MSIFFKKYPYPKRLCYPLVWQLYRTNLCGKVTIPGTLCATNKMTDCWKSHSPVSRGAGYGSERVAGGGRARVRGGRRGNSPRVRGDGRRGQSPRVRGGGRAQGQNPNAAGDGGNGEDGGMGGLERHLGKHLSCFSPMNLCKQFAPRLTGIINRYY